MKKSIYALISVVALWAASGSASGFTTSQGASCGQWISDGQMDGRNAVKALVHRTWLAGFLTGLAIASQKDILNGTDNESLFLWMDNYCKSSPLSDISIGGMTLYVELLKKNNFK